MAYMLNKSNISAINPASGPYFGFIGNYAQPLCGFGFHAVLKDFRPPAVHGPPANFVGARPAKGIREGGLGQNLYPARHGIARAWFYSN